ncbi:hypothetical protein FYJ24_07330 [Actinomycetaceae bacterium WB03_NA08]|uniref:Uncharacterized protein n=1 Tax=Scrofimicrobium canadense TaxID=2652290 RepID=A0A6N7W8H8_9ACTO|nr:hypothetical protein [Scrofimicrobium canadense]MSS84576.1 hypothetical protein [Scrofimicrobium canadense]
MELEPDYSDAFVVASVLGGEFSWYVTPPDYWCLDYRRIWRDADEQELEQYRSFFGDGYFHNKGSVFGPREDMVILDSKSAPVFLERIARDRASVAELREWLSIVWHPQHTDENDDGMWYWAWRPTFYVNFDEKVFYSSYTEPGSWERCAPEGWRSQWHSFLYLVPEEYRYWVLDSGVNVFARLEHNEWEVSCE